MASGQELQTTVLVGELLTKSINKEQKRTTNDRKQRIYRLKRYV
jgi:hypothetical protein